MRHRKHKGQLNRNASHRRCLKANMVKSLVRHGFVRTTLPKAKWVRQEAERMISLAKDGSLASRRRAMARLMINGERPSSRDWRRMREQGRLSGEKQILVDLFGGLASRFASRKGGYTRIVRTESRKGDGAQMCIVEYIDGGK